MAGKNQAIELAIFAAVADGGELKDDEIILAVQEQDDEAEESAIRKMITKLDRAGTITRQNSDSGYQITATGRSALDGLRSKMEARYIAPYSTWAPVEAVWTFLTPTLGCFTDPGGVGISRFPRVGETFEMRERTIERTGRGGKRITEVANERHIITPGRVALLGGWILTAFQKAAKKGDPTVTIDAAGVRRVLPDVAWHRVRVGTILMPVDQVLIRASRRPTNIRGQAIGEIVHEALPGGTQITIRANFPLSHFSEGYLINLFEQVQDVGISSAGTGKGGIWGVGVVSSLLINGRQVWPGHADTVTKAQKYASAPNEAPADAVLVSTSTGESWVTMSNGEHVPMPPEPMDLPMNNDDDDPRDRVKPETIRTVQGANGQR
jgi:hypothetical protein